MPEIGEDSNAIKWLEWWQDDMPCLYSRSQATDNAKFLEQKFGCDWFSKRDLSHPIQKYWHEAGAEGFIVLNSISENLRLLIEVNGIESIISNLKNSKEYYSTLLVLRSAGFFKRAGVNVALFYEQSDDSVPDYLIQEEDMSVAVECKQLHKSVEEINFNNYALNLEKEIRTKIFNQKISYPTLYVVLKNTKKLPDLDYLITEIKTAYKHISGSFLEVRRELANIFIDNRFAQGPNYKSAHILAPRSESENKRFLGKIKKANNQIKSVSKENFAGLVVLGVTEHQEANYISETLTREFLAPRFRSITAVLMLKFGPRLAPPSRTTIDLADWVVNPNPHKSMPENFRFLPHDESTTLIDTNNIALDVSAYRVQFVEIIYTAEEIISMEGMPLINLQPIDRIIPDLFS